MGSMFKWKVSSLTSRSSAKKADKLLNNNNNTNNNSAPVQPVQPVQSVQEQCDQRDNGPAPQTKVSQQQQQQQPATSASSTFSPLLPRSASTTDAGFAPRHQQPPPYHQHAQCSSAPFAGHHYNRPQTGESQQRHTDGSWNEWTQQLLAYTAWVNSQLRKRPELPLINDMGTDLQDGVLVAKLIEIITGKEVRGIDANAETHNAKRENFEKILAFLATQRVRTSTVTPRDLASGNLKSLMRLILSLASHYKPHSVKQGRDSASFRANSQTTPNLSVPTNRRFPSTGGFEAPEEADMKAITAVATLRRQNTHAGVGTKRPALASSSSAADLLSPGVQRRFTMTTGSAANRETGSQQFVSHFGTISNARSLANLPQQTDTTMDSPRQHTSMLTSSSVGDLNTSEEDSGTIRKPILKKDSKYGSRRELPALGVSGVVSKGRPSIFEFWENMLQSEPNAAVDSGCDSAENTSPSRSGNRRVLPPLPNQPTSLTVSTATTSMAQSSPGSSDVTLGSRGEVEGSSNQPSPTCGVGEIESGYWASLRNASGTGDDDLLISDNLGRSKNLLTSQQDGAMMTESKGTTTTSTDPDAISWLRSTLQSVDQRCSTLQSDLKKAQQDCLTLDGSRRGLAACLANQEGTLNSLKQELVRTTIANQTLTNEKIDLQRKLDEKDRQIADLRRQLAAKDRVMETQRAVLEEASQNFTPALRAKLDKNMSTLDARRNQYREELQVAREALASLRSNFKGNDPNHHTLDTLEQCMAFLLERIAGPDNLDVSSCNYQQQQSIISRYTNDSKRSLGNGFHGEQFTKVVYFTERTVTPFLTVIPRRLGEIALRDFKTLFDRPGVYRYHFKAQDPEYGFVKEEIADDNVILPGFDGKIIAWVEEIQL